MSSADPQISTFLFTAMIAVESLLVSVYGSLYTVYARYMTENGAPICKTIRGLSYLLSVIIVSSGLLALYAICTLYYEVSGFTWFIALALAVLVCSIFVPPIVISRRMYLDAAD